jgi:hypothetical protein
MSLMQLTAYNYTDSQKKKKKKKMLIGKYAAPKKTA